MSKYIWIVTYTPEGCKCLFEQGATKRQEQIADLARCMGGTLEAVYFSPDAQAFGIFDLPERPFSGDLACSVLAVNAAGQAQGKLQQLFTASEMDRLIEKARTVRVPGK